MTVRCGPLLASLVGLVLKGAYCHPLVDFCFCYWWAYGIAGIFRLVNSWLVEFFSGPSLVLVQSWHSIPTRCIIF
jgi:hypothetical protein